MNFSGITRAAGKVSLKTKKNAPNLLFAAGIAGTLGTVILACRATLKAQSVHEDHKNRLGHADHLMEKHRDSDAHKKHVTEIWLQTSAEYAKLYGPAFILGVTSIACLTKSHQILTTRNAALTSSLVGLDKVFKGYRERVVNELGQEKDTDFLTGVVEKEIVEDDGKGNPVVKRIKVTNPDAKHLYGRMFDEANRYWDKDHGYNHTFLFNQQKWANIELKRKGHLFLNEVYDLLGFERTAEGQLAGWVYDSTEGDSYVDFRFNLYPEFVNGLERSVFLDFNVEGNILGYL